MVAALIKFQQGPSVGTAGVAFVGALGTNVTATNASNASVERWKWTVIDSPAGSAVPIGVVSDGATNSYTFPADARGTYHLELEVFPAPGGSSSRHRLCFCVPELSGRKNPGFDAEAPALNFASTTRGWRVIMDAWLHMIDGTPPLVSSATGNIDAQATTSGGESVYSIRFTGAVPVLRGLASGYDGQRLFLRFVNAATIVNENATPSANDRIQTGTGGDVSLAAGSTAVLLYDGSSHRWGMVSGAAAATSPVVQEIHFLAGEFTTSQSGYDRAGARSIDLSRYPATIGSLNRVVRFYATVQKTTGATSIDVQIRDVTHGGAQVAVLNYATDVQVAELVSSPLTQGTGSGNVRTDGANYEVSARMNGGVLGIDAVYALNAYIAISYE